jgi:spore coat polysaccharide biosynthesis protein SpsF
MDMAKKFLSVVPQHQMVKFAKNGSTVTTAAVKLARAYTGRKLVAFPFDHPFYSYDDWFIGKTDCNKGVPDEISALSVTFKSCNIESLKALFEKHPGQIACVITEPEKSTCAYNCDCHGNPGEFIKEAIALAHEHGALFIVDEMVTGFKSNFPGSISKFNVEPDMATWGKGIANGFAFCALTGKKEIMEIGGIRNEGAEKVFLISTTHGAETHAMAAAIATIDEFQNKNVIRHNHGLNKYLIDLCQAVLDKHNINDYVTLVKSDWTPIFMFRDNTKNPSAGFRTLMLQEMIRRGILFQGAFVCCYSHTKQDVEYFAAALDDSLKVYKQALDEGFEKYLVGEPTKLVFRKYL